MSEAYGPVLPPHLRKRTAGDDVDRQEHEDSDGGSSAEDVVGPTLPEIPCRGPRPEDEMRQHNEESGEGERGAGDEVIGPALPPALAKRRQAQALQQRVDAEVVDDSDEVLIGPLPPASGSQDVGASMMASDIERRSERMRDKIEGRESQDQAPRREEWMLELPPEKAKNFGLGPRQFAKSTKPSMKKSDRSGWTDTPEQKAKRDAGELVEEDHAEDADVQAYLASLKRDQEMEKMSQELNAKRGNSSLMDMHTKHLKKKRQEEKDEQSKERRPFDRDLDLQANRFDNAQKELMLKKARQLNDRFSKGASKFL